MAVLSAKCYLAKPGELKPEWFTVDAEGKGVGRLASDIAMILMGKHKPTYTPHVLSGDFVIVLNAEKLTLSGRKWDQKEYTWFTGYTGLRKITAGKQLEKHPERIIREAVRRMLPKNKLATKMLAQLKVYVGTEHPHQAQKPTVKDLGNRKGASKAAPAKETAKKVGAK